MHRNESYQNQIPFYSQLLRRKPTAAAQMFGGPAYPALRGRVEFRQTDFGVLTAVQITGLPKGEGVCDKKFFGFHIHGGVFCTGDQKDAFADAKGHYDPGGCGHPNHAGDLPPLLGNRGAAFSVFLTDRFTVRDILGKTVIIHGGPDDFTTQPAGNAGQKIACGVIERV